MLMTISCQEGAKKYRRAERPAGIFARAHICDGLQSAIKSVRPLLCGPAQTVGKLRAGAASHQRRKHPQHGAEQAAPEAGANILGLHAAAFGDGIQTVGLQVGQRRGVDQQSAALEVQV